MDMDAADEAALAGGGDPGQDVDPGNKQVNENVQF